MTHRYTRDELRERADLAGEHRIGGTGQIIQYMQDVPMWLPRLRGSKDKARL